jgi:hypothetical protein
MTEETPQMLTTDPPTLTSTERPSSDPPLTPRDFRAWRLCTWAGVAYAVTLLPAFALLAHFVPPPRENWSAEHVAAFFRGHEVGIRLGMEGLLMFGLTYALLSISLARLMTRIEGRGGFLAGIQLLGGIITALITMGCALLWLTASLRAGSRSPSEIQLLNDVGWMTIDVTIMATILQFLAFGAACLINDGRPVPLFPRWLGYLSFFFAFEYLVEYVMPSVHTGPFAWQGLLSFYVALGTFGVWIVTVTVYALRAISTVQREPAR